MPFSALIGPAIGLVGGLLQGDSAGDAARTQAAAQERAAQLAAEESRFRPIGVTTRFGSSNFQTDANGRVSGAGYTLDPQFKAYQDQLMGLLPGGLTQAQQGQQQFAPLGQAAQGLFGLGQSYLSQTPQQAAQKYMAQQQELLAPSRERQLSQVQNSLFNTGRQGLAVGATGARPSGAAGLGAASPEMEAYYNAIAQQDAQLAAQATEGGMNQARFGAGLFDTGAGLIGKGFAGQAAAFTPYETYLNQIRSLEQLGQNPLDIGTALGGRNVNQTGANALYQGGITAAGTLARSTAFNPFSDALNSASSNKDLQRGIGNLFNNTNSMGNTIYNPSTGTGGFGGSLNPFFYGSGGSGD